MKSKNKSNNEYHKDKLKSLKNNNSEKDKKKKKYHQDKIKYNEEKKQK